VSGFDNIAARFRLTHATPPHTTPPTSPQPDDMGSHWNEPSPNEKRVDDLLREAGGSPGQAVRCHYSQCLFKDCSQAPLATHPSVQCTCQVWSPTENDVTQCKNRMHISCARQLGYDRIASPTPRGDTYNNRANIVLVIMSTGTKKISRRCFVPYTWGPRPLKVRTPFVYPHMFTTNSPPLVCRCEN
jgi:hypothetical protein